MSDVSLPQRAQIRSIRADFVEAKTAGLLRRHVLQPGHIADTSRLHCRCAEITGTTAHLHSCSYNEVLRTLGTNQHRTPGALENPPPP